MFGLPANEAVRTPAYRRNVQRRVARTARIQNDRAAINARSGFSLDANIIRPDGSDRWIRITAAVRGSNGRAENALRDETRRHRGTRAGGKNSGPVAECDPLTGVANRVRFQRFLERSNDDPLLNNIGALILFDLDGFKQLNDRWGHAAGDRCLNRFLENACENRFPRHV